MQKQDAACFDCFSMLAKKLTRSHKDLNIESRDTVVIPAKKNLEKNQAEIICQKSSSKIVLKLECDQSDFNKIQKLGTKITEKQQTIDVGSNASTQGESQRRNNGFDFI